MWIDDIMKAQILDVVVDLFIDVFGEQSVKPKGYLTRRKIFGIQSCFQEINLPVRVVFDLKPKRLDIFLLKIDTEYGSAFLRIRHCSGNTDAVPSSCLCTMAQIRIIKWAWLLKVGRACPNDHYKAHNHTQTYTAPI